MLSNFIIFRIYLCIAIIILFPVCYFLTVELLDQLIYYFVILKNFVIRQSQIIEVNDLNFLFNYFTKRKQWFQCITLLEFIEINKDSFNYLLGNYYYKLSYLYIAHYYYIKALNFDKNIKLLENLALVCKDLKDEKMMLEICSQIRDIDPDNSILLEMMI